jgi:hypothetical protein
MGELLKWAEGLGVRTVEEAEDYEVLTGSGVWQF